MAIVINGSGTVTGISVGGLPDGIVDAGTLATNSVDSAELIDGSIDTAHIAADQITGAILPAGSVLQVVSTSASGSTTSSSTYADYGLSVTITPSSTSSKIFVMIAANLQKDTGSNANSWNGRMMRDSTQLMSQTGLMWTNTSTYAHTGLAMQHLDSPSSTSALVYKLQHATTNNGYTVGARGAGANITVMEIAG
jgi:hypothetical protein